MYLKYTLTYICMQLLYMHIYNYIYYIYTIGILYICDEQMYNEYQKEIVSIST